MRRDRLGIIRERNSRLGLIDLSSTAYRVNGIKGERERWSGWKVKRDYCARMRTFELFRIFRHLFCTCKRNCVEINAVVQVISPLYTDEKTHVTCTSLNTLINSNVNNFVAVNAAETHNGASSFFDFSVDLCGFKTNYGNVNIHEN